MSLRGLSSRCGQGGFLLEPLGENVSLPFPASRGACSLWLMAPSSLVSQVKHLLTLFPSFHGLPLFLSLLPFSLRM